MRLLPCLLVIGSLAGSLRAHGESTPMHDNQLPVAFALSDVAGQAPAPRSQVPLKAESRKGTSYGSRATSTEPAFADDSASLPAERSAGSGGGGSAPVPEPGALFLVGTGLLGVALTARLRRRERRPQPRAHAEPRQS